MNRWQHWAFWLFALVASSVQAAGVDEVEATIRAKLETGPTAMKVAEISESELPGFFRVQFVDGPVVYATADGGYFFHGDLYQVNPEGYLNLAEQRRGQQRVEELAKIPAEEMIVYAPEGETKATITVFTDVDCGYCQKLHQEIPALNKQGIELRYLAYPRTGIGSSSYKKIASAWCAKDRNLAMDRLKARESIEENVCKGNPVAKHYLLGRSFGISGTPALVTDKGQLIPGYRPAEQLSRILGVD